MQIYYSKYEATRIIRIEVIRNTMTPIFKHTHLACYYQRIITEVDHDPFMTESSELTATARYRLLK